MVSPNAKKGGLMDLDLGYTRALIDAGEERGLLRNELAYVLATAYWETAGTVEPVREAYYLGEPAAEEYRKGLTYYPFYGRGFVQLTWQENYELAGSEIGIGYDLVDDPDLALDPEMAGMIIIMGMQRGWFTGKCLSDFITLARSDYVGARAIVNGSDCATDIAQLAEQYDAALLSIGYGVDEDQPERPGLPDVPLDGAALRAVLRQMADREAAQMKRIEALEAWAGGFPA